MFCTQCGTTLAENARFCQRCGAAVTAAQAAQPAAADPAGNPAPVYGQPVYPCFLYPVNTVAAPAAQPAAPQQDATPIYRRKAAPAPAQPAAYEETPLDGDDIFEGDTIPEPLPESDALLTVWQTVCCFFALFCLPVGNIIFACVWGFRANEHPQRRTMARAALPFITAGLLALFVALLWVTTNLSGISFTLR